MEFVIDIIFLRNTCNVVGGSGVSEARWCIGAALFLVCGSGGGVI